MAFLLGANGASANARGGEDETLTVRASQAELRGRPSLDATVTGLVRRGETVERVRSSADRRWIEVDIGGGELAWIAARAVEPGAAAPVVERHATLRMNRSASFDDDPPPDDGGRHGIESRRNEEVSPPPRHMREEPREVRNDPPPRRVEPAPREVRNDPPPVVKHETREVHADPPAAPPPSPVVKREPDPPSAHPLRDIPPPKDGELFAAYLDDERPPSGPTPTKKHK
jgi:hypothetical protein